MKQFINSQNVNQEVKSEILYNINNDGIITKPFNPKDVDIISQPMVISQIVENLRDGDIILDPDFQRIPDLWGDQKQSRLIESLIIRIPLPTFYFDAGDNDKLIVVDGLQRLYAIKRFMALENDDPQRLLLTGLEYLTEYNDYSACFKFYGQINKKRKHTTFIRVKI